MDNPLAEAIEHWSDFYLMIGTSSAALIGLLFVAVTFILDGTRGGAGDFVLHLARQSLGHFLFVLLASALFLTPGLSEMGIGWPLIGLGVVGSLRVVKLAIETRRARRANTPAMLPVRIGLPMVAYLLFIAVGIALLLGQAHGLYWMVPALLVLLGAACLTAWDLLAGGRPASPDTTSPE